MSKQDYDRFSDELIRRKLLANASIENYFIFVLQPGDDDSAVIQCCSDDGQLWTVVEENNDFAKACVKYLKEQGVPVFQEVADMQNYSQELQMRVRGGSI